MLTKFLETIDLGDAIFLLHLLTFNYCILSGDDMTLFLEQNYSAISDSMQKRLRDSRIFVESQDIDDEILSKAFEMFSVKPLRHPNIAIYLTNICNLQCSYCYSGYISAEKIKSVLTLDDIDLIFLTIEKYYNVLNLPLNGLGISLIGGEPLLKCTMSVVKYFFSRVKKFEPEFCEIVSNMVDSEKFLDIIKESGVPVVFRVTFNGGQKIHDKLRTNQTGLKTYRRQLTAIEHFLNEVSAVQFNISVLLDKNSNDIASIKQLFLDFSKYDLLDNPRIHIEFGHIQFRSNFDNNGYSKFVIPVERYYNELNKIAEKITSVNQAMLAGSSMHYLPKLARQWFDDEPYIPTMSGCDAARPGRLCFYVDGNIYPCYDVVGQLDFVCGRFRDDQELNDLFYEWHNFSYLSCHKCMECKYVAICNISQNM
ncbi:MAG: 4Fe-4S cluster-binding domain-containing protein [Clostridium sp.]|jgi:uncharacterized protein|nr:4Fe-4S cluster-binding domain-containing protein [Clostridium sp.]